MMVWYLCITIMKKKKDDFDVTGGEMKVINNQIEIGDKLYDYLIYVLRKTKFMILLLIK
jgi:hypothetical protein